MKKAFLIAIVGLMFSCSEEKKYEKPFIVVYSYPSSSDATANRGVANYEAQDKNGRIISFYDADYKYSVGDTLK